MKIIMETSLKNFKFWSDAKDTAKIISERGLWNAVDDLFSELCPKGLTDKQVNDVFRFAGDWLLEILGTREEKESRT